MSYEIIVVDNASSVDCESMLRNEFPGTTFIQSKTNLGFGRANNLGYSRSRGRNLLFLNPDTEVRGNAFAAMSSYLDSDRSVGGAGVRLLNGDGSLQLTSIQAFPTVWNQLLDSELLRRLFPNWPGWGTGALVNSDHDPAEVDAVSGACFMVKRGVFEQVGKFREEYFMYADDLDLSFRIHKAGFSIRYLCDCEVIHYGGKSSGQRNENFADVMQRDSLMRFFRAARGPRYAAVYRMTVAIAAVARVATIGMLIGIGKRSIHGKAPRVAVQKWLAILAWSLHSDAGFRKTGTPECV